MSALESANRAGAKDSFTQRLLRKPPWFERANGMHSLMLLGEYELSRPSLSPTYEAQVGYKAGDAVKALWRRGANGAPGEVRITALTTALTNVFKSTKENSKEDKLTTLMRGMLSAGDLATKVGVLGQKDALQYKEDALFSIGTLLVDYSQTDAFDASKASQFMSAFENSIGGNVEGKQKAQEAVLTGLYSKVWQRIPSDHIEKTGQKKTLSSYPQGVLTKKFQLNLQNLEELGLFKDQPSSVRAQLAAFSRETKRRRIGTDKEKLSRLFRKTLEASAAMPVYMIAFSVIPAVTIYAYDGLLAKDMLQMLVYEIPKYPQVLGFFGVVSFLLAYGAVATEITIGPVRRDFFTKTRNFIDAYYRHARGESIAPRMVLVGEYPK